MDVSCTAKWSTRKIIGANALTAAIAFSPDGSRIVSSSRDMTLRFWDAKSGAPIGEPLRGHEDWVSSVAFSQNGIRIVSSSRDKTLRLWPGPKIWPDELCKKLTHNMSYQQWKQWVSPDTPYIEQCPGLPIPPDAPVVKEKSSDKATSAP